jgi:hypothetical protein
MNKYFESSPHPDPLLGRMQKKLVDGFDKIRSQFSSVEVLVTGGSPTPGGPATLLDTTADANTPGVGGGSSGLGYRNGKLRVEVDVDGGIERGPVGVRIRAASSSIVLGADGADVDFDRITFDIDGDSESD